MDTKRLPGELEEENQSGKGILFVHGAPAFNWHNRTTITDSRGRVQGLVQLVCAEHRRGPCKLRFFPLCQQDAMVRAKARRSANELTH